MINNDLLNKALRSAFELGHYVYINNYPNLESRRTWAPKTIDFKQELLHEDGIDKSMMPAFDADGCNDVCIYVSCDAHQWEYHVWYSDNAEDRFSDIELKSYLELCKEVAA